MKETKIDMIPTASVGDKETATVTEFFPRAHFGYAKTEAGEIIHFNMSASRVLIRGTAGPFFSLEQKHTCPKKGDVLCFIRRNEPVAPGKKPSMFIWNFEESYQRCMQDCNKFGPDHEALKALSEPQESVQTTSNQQKTQSIRGQYHNSPRHTYNHTEYGVDCLPEWNRDPKLPAPNINLVAEFKIADPSLEKLARSAGGKNGGTRKIHQAARTHRMA